MVANNKYPEGSTHIHMTEKCAQYSRRVDDGWCLLGANGEWIFCGEELAGYMVAIGTGIIWEKSAQPKPLDLPLAYVVTHSNRVSIGLETLPLMIARRATVDFITKEFVDSWEPAVPEVLAYVCRFTGLDEARGLRPTDRADNAYSFDTITKEFVDNWHPVRAPANQVRPGQRIPVYFSCPVGQYAYDNGIAIEDSPRPGFYGRMAARLARELVTLKAEAAARESSAVTWRPMDTAPRDGQMLRLLVQFTSHPTEDEGLAPTIGSNNLENDEVDEWKFAGWCWTHDHFVDGEGEPIGWLPMLLGGDK